MKNFIKTIFFVYMFLGMNLSHAASNERIPLWGATYYGMTLKEMLTSVPNAKPITVNVSLSFLEPNAKASAKLENVEIAGEAFNVWFIFNNDKLSQVTLSLISKMDGTNNSMPSDYLSALYAHYSLLLTAKYGNSLTKTWQDYAPTNTHLWNTQWVSGLTNIDLNVEKTQLEINYRAQYAEDLRKL